MRQNPHSMGDLEYFGYKAKKCVKKFFEKKSWFAFVNQFYFVTLHPQILSIAK
jgi:hypothetical protein